MSLHCAISAVFFFSLFLHVINMIEQWQDKLTASLVPLRSITTVWKQLSDHAYDQVANETYAGTCLKCMLLLGEGIQCVQIVCILTKCTSCHALYWTAYVQFSTKTDSCSDDTSYCNCRWMFTFRALHNKSADQEMLFSPDLPDHLMQR